MVPGDRSLAGFGEASNVVDLAKAFAGWGEVSNVVALPIPGRVVAT